MTEYLRPRTLDEAVALRTEHPAFTVLAGGTDLMVAANRKPTPPGIIDVFGVGDLVGICRDERGITIGAATPYRDILTSGLVTEHLPALSACVREIGALQIQARGTMGGNIATSSPVGDTLPVLLALDAVVVLASARGRREVPYSEFCTGYRTTALGPDELICAVRFPEPPDGLVQMWRKMGTRRAQSISKVMVAAAALVSGGTITLCRIGIGAVAATPIRARAAEAALIGQQATPATAEAAARAVLADVTPISDVRSTAEYRGRVAANVVRRFALSLADSPS